jgi:formate dehydrogenase major subunit
MALEGRGRPWRGLTDPQILAGIFLKLKAMYAKDGGTFPDAINSLSWAYGDPHEPKPEELAKELNGKALADLPDPKNPGQFLAKKGELLPGFALLQADGSTASGCWILPAAGPRPATRWHGATTATRPALATRWAGPGRGRPTAASCTTAPPASPMARHGTKSAR